MAGVSLSTFPYALDVTAKVTTLRDFFITLFFVALGMTIPVPNLSVVGLALIIAAFTVVSRMVTTFTPLYLMKQGLRASLLPAINLAQISEFSLVVIQTGVAAGHIKTETASAASFAFSVLAAGMLPLGPGPHNGFFGHSGDPVALITRSRAANSSAGHFRDKKSPATSSCGMSPPE